MFTNLKTLSHCLAWVSPVPMKMPVLLFLLCSYLMFFSRYLEDLPSLGDSGISLRCVFSFIVLGTQWALSTSVPLSFFQIWEIFICNYFGNCSPLPLQPFSGLFLELKFDIFKTSETILLLSSFFFRFFLSLCDFCTILSENALA